MTVAVRGMTVQLIGGPYDGYTVQVPVDDEGNPPEYRRWEATTSADFSVNPGYGAIARIVTWFYDRDVSVDGQGNPVWVYRFAGEHVSDAGNAAA